VVNVEYPRLTKVTRKGQVTIPEEMREAYGISEGDFMLVGGTKGLIMLRKLALPSWKELFEHGEKFAEKERITRQQILKAVREIRRGR
jgi:AbrB family looped-hinge helix DNA binding protein